MAVLVLHAVPVHCMYCGTVHTAKSMITCGTRNQCSRTTIAVGRHSHTCNAILRCSMAVLVLHAVPVHCTSTSASTGILYGVPYSIHHWYAYGRHRHWCLHRCHMPWFTVPVHHWRMSLRSKYSCTVILYVLGTYSNDMSSSTIADGMSICAISTYLGYHPSSTCAT